MENPFDQPTPREPDNRETREEEKLKEKYKEGKDKDKEKYKPEYYEPVAYVSQTANIIGWIIAIILFVLAIWLLWISLS